MPSPARSAKTVVFYDLIELKKAKFQLLCDKCRLKKAILI